MAHTHRKPWIVRYFLSTMTWIGILTTALFLFTAFGPWSRKQSGNIAHIKLYGPIVSVADDGGFGSPSHLVVSTRILQVLSEIEEDPDIHGILLEINSPGGTPVASEEIARHIHGLSKPTVTWMREIGTSGAYWVAAASDHIVAHPLSITGSIGVLANQFGFEDFIERFNIHHRRQVAGNLKDIGDPFRAQTDEEKQIFQNILDTMHQYFKDSIAAYRKLPEGWEAKAGNGLFFLGEEALALQLVDQLGAQAEAEAWLETQIQAPVELREYAIGRTLFDSFLHGLSALPREWMLRFSLPWSPGRLDSGNPSPFRT